MNLSDPLLSAETSARLERLVRLARRVRARRKRGALKEPGKGIEPGARRDYVPGDDVRRIDWQAYARLERLLYKVTEDLPEARLDLVIDGSASMRCGDPPPALRAALAAAGLAAVAVARELRAGVWIGGSGADHTTLARPSELVRLLRFLARERAAGGGPNLLALATRISERVRRSGPAVLLSDGLDPELVPAALRLAARRQVRVGFLDVAGEVSEEDTLGLGEGLRVELVDAERGTRLQRVLGPAGLERALEERRQRQRELQARLEPKGVRCLWLGSEDPFERLAEALL